MKQDQEITIPAETIVLAVGVQANRKLPDALDDSDLDFHVIRDAVEPCKAFEAIKEGFEVGNRI
jgi:hypothetical protein